jgi:hypothetical protein
MEYRAFYICKLCGYTRFHQAVYCPKCPGTFEHRGVKVDWNWRTDAIEKLREQLKQQGLELGNG